MANKIEILTLEKFIEANCGVEDTGYPCSDGKDVSFVDLSKTLRKSYNDGWRIYRITADYRKMNPNKPFYFVYATNSRNAKQRFTDCFEWLDIYGCEECDYNLMRYVMSHRAKYIII